VIINITTLAITTAGINQGHHFLKGPALPCTTGLGDDDDAIASDT